MEYKQGNEEECIEYLKKENSKYNEDLNGLRKLKRELMTKEHSLADKIESNNKQIKKYKDLINVNNMFKQLESMENFKILNGDELIAISNGIDKNDYTKYGTERFHDLDQVINQVISIKTKYSDWVLDELTIQGQYDTLPPKNFYKYIFKTPNGYFSTGGCYIKH